MFFKMLTNTSCTWSWRIGMFLTRIFILECNFSQKIHLRTLAAGGSMGMHKAEAGKQSPWKTAVSLKTGCYYFL